MAYLPSYRLNKNDRILYHEKEFFASILKHGWKNVLCYLEKDLRIVSYLYNRDFSEIQGHSQYLHTKEKSVSFEKNFMLPRCTLRFIFPKNTNSEYVPFFAIDKWENENITWDKFTQQLITYNCMPSVLCAFGIIVHIKQDLFSGIDYSKGKYLFYKYKLINQNQAQIIIIDSLATDNEYIEHSLMLKLNPVA